MTEKKKAPVVPIALGCVSLIGLFFTCTTFGSAFYFFDEASSYESRASSARMDEARGYGSYFLDSGYYERRAEENEQFAYGSLCCGAISLLMLFGGAIGGFIAFRRHKAAGAEAGPPGSGPGTPAPGSGPGTPPPGGGFGAPPAGPGGTPPPGGGFGGPGTPPPPGGGGFGPPR